MRRWGVFLLALIISTAVAGCAKAPQDGYTIMFEGPIHVYDDGVYYSGGRVGEVQSIDKGAGNVTRVVVRFSSDFIQKMGNNFALYLDSGRLSADKLQGMGGSLQAEIPFCGFRSKAAFNWFKFKTLLNNRIPAAKHRALALLARMG